MEFNSLGQTTMPGFLTGLFIVPEKLWIIYYFHYSKACSVLPCTALRLSATQLHTSTIRKPVLLQQYLETQAFLAKYWYVTMYQVIG